MSSKPLAEETFTSAQLAMLESEFPQLTLGPTKSEAELRNYHGQQSVVLFVRSRTRGVNPRIPSSGNNIPTP